MLPVSMLFNPTAASRAELNLSSSPKLPSLLAPKNTAFDTRDVFVRSDGSEATRDDFVPKTSGADLTPEEAAAKIRDRADRIRLDAEAKAAKPKKETVETAEDKQVRELLHQFVGQVLFGQMLKAMRSTQEKNPYFHGGRTEEIFQGQLDMVLAEELTKSSSGSLSDPMYNLMRASKRSTD